MTDFVGPLLPHGRRYSTNCAAGTRRAKGSSHACVSTPKRKRSSSSKKRSYKKRKSASKKRSYKKKRSSKKLSYRKRK